MSETTQNQPPRIKVRPFGKHSGTEFVEIFEFEFIPDYHELYEEQAEPDNQGSVA